MYNEASMNKRRSYRIKTPLVNDLLINKVIISSHYEESHLDHMTDELILELVKQLDGRKEFPAAQKDGYSYFATLIEYANKPYKLIWLLEDGAIYIGIVTAHRLNIKR
jgi:hypothetical protein